MSRVTVTWGLTALGVLLRAAALVRGRSLRYDEAALALNVMHKDLGALLQGLDRMQSAPLGFLALERLFSSWLGPEELVLRLVPFAAGILSLLLFRSLACRLLDPVGAAFAVALYACNEKLIFHAADVKQYSVDALATVLLLGCLHRREWSGQRPRDLVLLGLAGAVLLPFSFPACLVLAGLGTAALLAQHALRRWRNVATLGGCALGWLAVFGACQALSMRISDVEGLREFWKEDFLPFPPRSAADWGWLLEKPLQAFRTPGGVTPAVLGAALAVLGGVGLFRKDRWKLVAWTLPLFLALGASALRLYPFHARFLLFAVPFLALLLGVSLGEVFARTTALRHGLLRHGVRLALAVLVLRVPLESLTFLFHSHLNDPDLRSVMRGIADRGHGDDLLYVADPLHPTFLYYRETLASRGLPHSVRELPRPAALERLGPEVLDAGPAWFCFTYPPPRLSGFFRWREPDETGPARAAIDAYRRHLDTLAVRRDTVEARGAVAYRYVPRGSSDPPVVR